MVEAVTAFIVAAGIPSALVGIFVRRFEKRLDKKEKSREEHDFLMIKSINAAIALGEATAEAVARIPDANCNGDMHAALKYAREVKHEQKDFMTRQTAQAIN